jgi:glycosyltransferase involved in cell wall biosynthesis
MAEGRILFLTGAAPYPLTTGAKIRTFNLLKALAGLFEIHLLTVLNSEEENGYIPIWERAGLTCHCLYSDRMNNAVGKRLDALSSFLLAEPYLTRHYTFRAYRRQIDQLLRETSFDVIHCDSISLAGNLGGLDKNRLVLTQHNIEQIIWAGYVEHAGSGLTRIFYQNQFRKVKRLEENLGRTFGYVVTVSEEDRKRLALTFPSDKIVVAENGVDPQAYETDVPFERRRGVVFTGSLDWHPNIDGLKYFADDIFPHLHTHCPDCPVTVVGRRPPAVLKDRLAELPGTMLHADVPEIQPYLHGARVMMVPLRIAGGSRLKILEAMASGLPVVATTKGAEGLAVKDDENIIIRDDPEQFAFAIGDLCRNDDRWRRLSRNGRELVVERYAWDKVVRPQAELWRSITNG